MRRVVVAIVVLLAGGFVAWMALRPGADGGPTVGGLRSGVSPGPGDRPVPSGEPGSSAPAASLRGAPEAPTTEPSPPDVGATGAGPVLALVGEVEWVGEPRPGAFDVAMRSVGFGGMVWGGIEAEGKGEGRTFRLDISDFVRREPATAQLEVEIDHPDAVTERVRVDLPRGAGEDVHEIPVRVTLRPALVLTGSILDREGHPVEAGVVAAFEMGPDGPVYGDTQPVLPAAEAAVRKHQDAGRFRFRLLAEGRYLLIALAQPLRPAGREVAVARGEPREIEPFVLLPGETIEGVVRRGGEAVPKASISAMALVEEALPLLVEGTEVRWSPTGKLHVDRDAEADEEEALPDQQDFVGQHVVRAFVPDDVFGQVRAVLDRNGGDRVDAPARGLVIDLVPAGAALELRVESEGRPLAGVGVQLHIRGTATMGTTGEDGTWRYEVPPEQDVDVTIRADGYESAHVVLRAGAAGSVVTHAFDLVPTAPGPVLVVKLTEPVAGEVESCWFAITPLSATPAQVPVAGGPPMPAPPYMRTDRVEKPAERREDGTGIYRLEGLLAGRPAS